MIVDLSPPIVEPWRLYFLRLFFSCCNLLLLPTFDIQGSCGSRYPESLMPIVLGTIQKCLGFSFFQSVPFWEKDFHRNFEQSAVFMALLSHDDLGVPTGDFGVCLTWELYMLKCHQMSSNHQASSNFIKFDSIKPKEELRDC